MLERDEERLVVEHPVLGRIEIPVAQIKVEVEEPEKRGLFGSSVLRGWNRNVAIGFSGSSGNSSEANVNAGLKIHRDTERYRGIFDSGFFYGSKDSVAATQRFFAGYKHDFLIKDSRWFFFGSGQYDYDLFQSWLHRVSGNGGVGYDIIEHEKFDLRGNLGVGVARTWGTDQDTKPEGVVGMEFKWIVTEGQTFKADATYYPNLKNSRSSVCSATRATTSRWGCWMVLSLSLGLRDDYTSEVDPGFEENNLNYFGNLVYDF